MTLGCAVYLMCRSDDYSVVNDRRTKKEPLPRMLRAERNGCSTSGVIFYSFVVLDLILAVGLSIKAWRLAKINRKKAQHFTCAAASIPIIWTLMYLNYTYCCDCCLPQFNPKFST